MWDSLDTLIQSPTHFAARASLRLLRSLMLTMSRALFSLTMSRTLLWYTPWSCCNTHTQFILTPAVKLTFSGLQKSRTGPVLLLWPHGFHFSPQKKRKLDSRRRPGSPGSPSGPPSSPCRLPRRSSWWLCLLLEAETAETSLTAPLTSSLAPSHRRLPGNFRATTCRVRPQRNSSLAGRARAL